MCVLATTYRRSLRPCINALDHLWAISWISSKVVEGLHRRICISRVSTSKFFLISNYYLIRFWNSSFLNEHRQDKVQNLLLSGDRNVTTMASLRKLLMTNPVRFFILHQTSIWNLCLWCLWLLREKWAAYVGKLGPKIYLRGKVTELPLLFSAIENN